MFPEKETLSVTFPRGITREIYRRAKKEGYGNEVSYWLKLYLNKKFKLGFKPSELVVPSNKEKRREAGLKNLKQWNERRKIH